MRGKGGDVLRSARTGRTVMRSLDKGDSREDQILFETVFVAIYEAQGSVQRLARLKQHLLDGVYLCDAMVKENGWKV